MATDITDFIDSPWIMPYHLDAGREYVLTIHDYRVERLPARDRLKATTTVSLGVGAKRRLLLSSNTNKLVVAAMHGRDVEKWPGKQIAIQVGRFPRDPGKCDRVVVCRPTPTRGAGARDDAASIRDDAPPPGAGDAGQPPADEPREPGSDG